MAKTTTLTTTLPSAFLQQIAALKQLYEDIQEGSTQLAAMYVRYCRLYYDASENAVRIDGTLQSGATAALEANFAHVDQSVRSKWRKIGEEHKTLLRADIVKALPPTRDALYELAKFANQYDREETAYARLAALVQKGHVTPESSVTAIRSLVTPTPKGKKKPRTLLATVTLGFETYDKAAIVLTKILQSDADLRIGATDAFKNAVMTLLGKDGFKNIAHRFR